MSSFTTDYPPGETRVINIHRGADLLNNTVVEPGKVFSLNQTVGPRTAARGFVTAPVFAQGEFFDDYGGGVSQLATTTYNAAFFGGYADVTHQPHTIYISRYPPGREATVNYGVIDLQFRDDTPPRDPHPRVLQRDVGHGRRSTATTTAGPCTRRTARRRTRSPVTDQLIQCPASKTRRPERRVRDARARARREQVSTGDAGFDVAFDRVIDQPGPAAQRREHYTWHYTMLPNQILVGSGSTASTTPATSRRVRRRLRRADAVHGWITPETIALRPAQTPSASLAARSPQPRPGIVPILQVGPSHGLPRGLGSWDEGATRPGGSPTRRS